MLQAPMFNGLSFDPFALFDDGWRPGKVDIGSGSVAQVLMVALVIVVFDNRIDLKREVAVQELILQQNMACRGRCQRALPAEEAILPGPPAIAALSDDEI